ncbi:MAG TPA: PepSY domain-containing protein [archaeon]|nr:PepSY domain-containing protein [archaeon]
MKMHGIVFLSAFFAILFSAAAFAAACTDSDNGINYAVKGTTTGVQDQTTGQIVTVTDMCGGDWNNEFYCGTWGSIKDLIVQTSNKCSYGCQDGVCLRNPATGKMFRDITNCIDSDGEGNFKEKGYIQLSYDDGTGEKLDDYCGFSSGGGSYGVLDYFCGQVYYFNEETQKQEDRMVWHYWSVLKPGKCKDGLLTEENFELENVSISQDSIKVSGNEVSISVPTQAVPQGIVIKENLLTKNEIQVVAEEVAFKTREKITITQTEIKVAEIPIRLPNEVAEAVKNIKIEEMELKKVEGILQYEIDGTKDARFLWIIPVELDATVQVDAASGNVIKEEVQRPWWFVGS